MVAERLVGLLEVHMGVVMEVLMGGGMGEGNVVALMGDYMLELMGCEI